MNPVEIEFPAILLVIVLFYWFAPYASQRTIKFGVRVTPERTIDPVFNKMLGTYHAWLAIASVLVFTLFILIPDFYGFFPINTLSFLVEIVAVYSIYFVIHGRVKRFKELNGWYQGVREAAGVVIPVTGPLKKDYVYPVMLAFSAVIVVATIIMGAILYPSLPNTLVTHYAQNGIPNGFERKNLIDVFNFPILQAILTVSLFLVSLAIWRSRQEIEVFKPRTSYLQQQKFKKYNRYAFAAISISVNVTIMLLAAIHWGILNRDYGSLLIYLPISAIILVYPPMIYLGQQGSRIKIGFPEQPTGLVNMNDDEFWKGGVIYLNRKDRSFVVAKRFGIGWTINFGNPISWIILATIFIIPFISVILVFH